MGETHQLLFHHHLLMSYALIFIAFLTALATGVVGWVVWLTRNLAREGREFQRELEQRFEQSKHESERFNHYLFGKLGPLDSK